MPDKLNYIKNMIWMMCCDGKIVDGEKKFLRKAAKEISVDITDWNKLLKEVVAAGQQIYPIADRDKAIATLQSLVVMAKASGTVEDVQRDGILKFAKSIGISNDQWRQVRANIDMEKLFDPFKVSPAAKMNMSGSILVLSDDFEKIDELMSVASDFGAKTTAVSYNEFIAAPYEDGCFVCFHAVEKRSETVNRCTQIMEKAGKNTVAILTRFQGHHVQYMRETGLQRCIIEPVYTQDIVKLLKSSN